MKLADYIKNMGDAKAAELFGVKARTVASWRRGERRPSPDKATSIVDLTKGKVTFADIYRAEEAA